MKTKYFFLLTLILLHASCTEDDKLLNDITSPVISAKDRIEEVLSIARTDFASDAKLSLVYGRNVDRTGTINLADFSELKAFIYAVQSDQKQSNEFYVPVFGAGPVKSPVNFRSMLDLIKNPGTKNTMSAVLGKLSTLTISGSANYPDSDQVIQTALNNGGGSFLNQYSDGKIDMFLLPSKSLLDTGLENSADWVVHFYSSAQSLVLWINTSTGIITTL